MPLLTSVPPRPSTAGRSAPEIFQVRLFLQTLLTLHQSGQPFLLLAAEDLEHFFMLFTPDGRKSPDGSAYTFTVNGH